MARARRLMGPIEMLSMVPMEYAATFGVRSRIGSTFRNCAAFLGNDSTSQLWPDNWGVATRRSRLEPNTSAAASARMLRLAPNMVVRTGTAVLPRPGPMAIRTPAVALGGKAHRAIRAAI